MLSLNDGGTSQKHYKDIYPTELEPRKENKSNSCAFFLDLYIYIENGEFHTTLFDKWDKFGFKIERMPFYCSSVPSKIFYASIGAEFLRISRAASKIEDLSCNCKQLNVKTRWANEKNQIFLNKNDPTTSGCFD